MVTTRRTAAAGVFALLAASLAAAQQPPPPPPGPGPHPAPGLMRRMGPELGVGGPEIMVFQPSRLVDRRQALALTPDQVSRLEALSQEAERARTQADSVARTLRDQLQELWDAPEPDVAQLRSRAQAAMQAHQTAALASLEAAAKARAVLTAEQRGRVAGWLEGARTGRSMRMRRPMDGPGRPGRRR